ncbi:hypothetical protein PYV61_23785, partial [Roseisolibacter sp. H3M3-2]
MRVRGWTAAGSAGLAGLATVLACAGETDAGRRDVALERDLRLAAAATVAPAPPDAGAARFLPAA